MKLSITVAAGVLAATAAQAAPFGAPSAVGPSGPQLTFMPIGINDPGQVAGTVTDTSAGTPSVYGFLTGARGVGGTAITAPGGNLVIGGLNNVGVTAGTIQPASGDTQVFTRAPGGATLPTDSGNISATVTGISATGTVIGTTGTQAFTKVGGGALTTFNASAPGDATTPAGINAAGTVVGNAIVGGVSTPFTRDAAGTVTFFPVGTGDAFATGINDRGVIVGNASLIAGDVSDGFITDGTTTTLSVPQQAFGTFVTGINNAGEVVGYYQDASANYDGFVYQDGQFYTVVYPASAAQCVGGCSTVLFGVNNGGDVVGLFTPTTGNPVAFTLATVPEPGAIGVVFAGAVALLRRRR